MVLPSSPRIIHMPMTSAGMCSRLHGTARSLPAPAGSSRRARAVIAAIVSWLSWLSVGSVACSLLKVSNVSDVAPAAVAAAVGLEGLYARRLGGEKRMAVRWGKAGAPSRRRPSHAPIGPSDCVTDRSPVSAASTPVWQQSSFAGCRTHAGLGIERLLQGARKQTLVWARLLQDVVPGFYLVFRVLKGRVCSCLCVWLHERLAWDVSVYVRAMPCVAPFRPPATNA